MKKKIILTISLIVPMVIFADWEFEIGLNSRYIWRGFDLLPDNNPALQPSITYNFGQSGFSLNLWGSFALKERSFYREADEIDLTLNYDFDLKKLIISVGLIHYGYYFAPDFNFKQNTTQEIYLGLTLLTLPFVPRLKLYYDFNLGKGLYLEAGISRDFQIKEKIGLNLDIWQGYNGGQFGVKKGFSDFNISSTLQLDIGSLSVQPFIWYCRIFNDEINKSNSELVAGVRMEF